MNLGEPFIILSLLILVWINLFYSVFLYSLFSGCWRRCCHVCPRRLWLTSQLSWIKAARWVREYWMIYWGPGGSQSESIEWFIEAQVGHTQSESIEWFIEAQMGHTQSESIEWFIEAQVGHTQSESIEWFIEAQVGLTIREDWMIYWGPGGSYNQRVLNDLLRTRLSCGRITKYILCTGTYT